MTLSPDTAVVALVLFLAVSGGWAVFGFLIRRTFNEFSENLQGVVKDVAEMKLSTANRNGDIRLLERDVADCKAEVKLNRDRYHELAQQVTLLRGLVETKRTASGEHRVPT